MLDAFMQLRHPMFVPLQLEPWELTKIIRQLNKRRLLIEKYYIFK
jgi:hypothetical protein